MAELIKLECATCGGRIEKVDDSIYRCSSCSSKYERDQSQSKSSNLSEVFLAARARQRGDFDESLKMYEDIIIAEKDNFDAMWGAMLADISVVYSMRDNVALPIFYDAKKDVITNNKYFKKAMSLCPYAEDYRNIAIKIEALRIAARQQVSKNKVDVVVICREKANDMPTNDARAARLLVTQLKANGLKVFCSLTDLASCPYDDYEPYIYGALHNAKVAVVIASCEDNLNIDYVRNAWKRFIRHSGKATIVALCDCEDDILPVELRKIAEHILVSGNMSVVANRVNQILAPAPAVKSNPVPKEPDITASTLAIAPVSADRVASTSGSKVHECTAPPTNVQVDQIAHGTGGDYGSIHTNSEALSELADSIKAYNNAQKMILDQCMSSLRQLSYQWKDNHIDEIINSMSNIISNYDAKSNQANSFGDWLMQKAIILNKQKNIRN